jgi:dGTPase
MNTLDIIRDNLLKREDSLKEYACKSKDAIRLYEKEEDIRPAFFHDTDIIIHSSSYARYMDKTQVYSFKEHDHISKRMLHVQLVSKIARTIGRCLNLNEDLIEAIGLGHDIGHTPLGHTGEKFLNEISMKELGIPFMHNLQSVRMYLTLDNHGLGSNLSIQVLDGMMCHNGERLEKVYKPKKKTKEEFIHDYEESCKSVMYANSIRPMTLEGCVVRVSDVIAYIGRDIEDAITLGLLKRNQIPKDIVTILGDNNKTIVNSIVLDIINNSYGKNEIILSDKVFDAMNKLIEFNYKNIYNNANTSDDLNNYRDDFYELYKYLLNDLNINGNNSIVFNSFLKDMDDSYLNGNNNQKIIIDYIAGMTDDFFINQINKIKSSKS